jgi:cell division protease FtsH
MEYGMSETLGPITLGKKHDQIFLGRDLARDRDYSEEIAKAIDQEIRKTIDNCYQKAQDILEKERDKLEKLAQTLLDKETLDADEIKALVEGSPLPKKKEQSSELTAKSSDDKKDNQEEQTEAMETGSGVKDKPLNDDLKEEKIKVINSKTDRRASFKRRSEQKKAE